MGRAWATALAAVGVVGATVHGGPTRPATRWSAAVCFGGLGPGEVVVDGAKVVGISQRRTRTGALFQCGALLRWDPRALANLLGLADEAVADLERVAAGIGPAVTAAALTAAFEVALQDVREAPSASTST